MTTALEAAKQHLAALAGNHLPNGEKPSAFHYGLITSLVAEAERLRAEVVQLGNAAHHGAATLRRAREEVERLRGESGARLSLLREIRRKLDIPGIDALGDALYKELCGVTDEIPAASDIFRDALRYRWLKEHHLQLGPDCWIRSGDDLDEAIDAELDEAGKSPDQSSSA